MCVQWAEKLLVDHLSKGFSIIDINLNEYREKWVTGFHRKKGELKASSSSGGQDMVKRQLYQQTIIIPSSSSSSSYEPNNPNQLFFWFGPLYILTNAV